MWWRSNRELFKDLDFKLIIVTGWVVLSFWVEIWIICFVWEWMFYKKKEENKKNLFLEKYSIVVIKFV